MYLFTKPPFALALTIILAVAAALISSADDAKDRQECAQSLTGLATCLPYVGGTAKSPTPDCCAGLKQLLNTNKKCLCLVIKDKDDPDLGLKINVTLALGLPQVCNAAAPNISHCPVLLGLPPNSSEAQMFYELGNNSSSSGNISPVAGGPTTSIRNPTTAPLQGATPHQKNGATNTMSSYLTPLWLCAFTVFYICTSSFY